MGIRFIIRDHLGLVCAVLSIKIHAPLGPLEIEAKAMEEGIVVSIQQSLKVTRWWFITLSQAQSPLLLVSAI